MTDGLKDCGEIVRIAAEVADKCHAPRKPGAAPQRWAMIYQAARIFTATAALKDKP